jgi:phosphoglucomutase
MNVSPFAGKPATPGMLVDVARLVVEMEVIRGAKLNMGVDPLGGAGVHYWGRIAERYGLSLAVVNEAVDPTFRFMTVDWDGQIRMDPSSAYAMQRLIGMKDRFDLSFACDTDHDRHGIVTKSEGLLPPNHYLCAAIDYLFQNGTVWTTDKDGIVPALLEAEITARLRRDPGEIYHELTRRFGEPAYDRVEAPATPAQKERLAKLSPRQVKFTELAGEIWRRNHEQTNTCRPSDLQPSTHGSRGVRFPGGACPGYALVVEPCDRQGVAAA